jgi:ligand-binding sensor domain-containing protein
LSHDRVLSLCEDRSGVLWIGTNGGGLNKLVPGDSAGSPPTFVRYQYDPNHPNSLSSNLVLSVCADRSGALWIGTDGGGINRFDPITEQFLRFRHDGNNPNSLSHDRIVSLYQDDSGVLWIGTNGGGLNKLVTSVSNAAASGLGASAAIFQHYRNDPNDPNSLSNNHVWSLAADRTGVLWIGTEFGGVNRLDPYKEKFNHYTTDPNHPNSLNDKSAWSLCEDHAGNLWIGTRAGGLNKFDRKMFSHSNSRR